MDELACVVNSARDLFVFTLSWSVFSSFAMISLVLSGDIGANIRIQDISEP